MTPYTYRVTCEAPGERAVFEWLKDDGRWISIVMPLQPFDDFEGQVAMARWHTVTLSRYPADDPAAVEVLREWTR